MFEFKPVVKEEVAKAVWRAFDVLTEELGQTIDVDDETVLYVATACGGDVRKAINAVELSVLASPVKNGVRYITLETVRQLAQKSAMRYDKSGDEHYDIVSAYQKSMRGSDSDAALHYLGRLLAAGDLPSACRRLLVCVCEDVGLAYPQAISIVKACVDIALQVGLPEARIPLADAVVLVCNAPKSNSAYQAIDLAMQDIESGKIGIIPRALQNMHYDGDDNENKGQFYKYPQDYPNHWVAQQYLPDVLAGSKYYVFGDNKNEQAFKMYWDKIKK